MTDTPSVPLIDPVALTQDLVRCPSITPLDAGALEVMATALRGLGFEVTRLRFEEEGTDPIDNIFARRGTGGPHLCYLGHTDVVPVGRESDWVHPPFAAVIDGDKLYGRGASDMKSGNAAFVAAVSRFLQHKPDFDGSISLLITGDEEALSVNGTVKVVEWMRLNGQLPDMALVGEPSNPGQMGQVMRVGRRGSWNARLFVDGVQGHSAYPERVDNPIPKMLLLLNRLVAERLDEGNAFFPPSHIVISSVDVGNSAPNIIPAHIEALLNIRFNSEWTSATLEAHIRSILDEDGVPYRLECWCNAESFLVKDAAWRQIVADAITEQCGAPPRFDTGGGTSDARHIAPYCPVVEYGVTNATIHKVDEYVKLEDIHNLTETYTRILARTFV